jgi:phosphomannomutase
MADTRNVLILFDVDGTLTPSRLVIKPEMKAFLAELKKKAVLGIVGGSDYPKMEEQMGGAGFKDMYDYVFPENGLVAYHNGELFSKMSIKDHMGEEKIKRFDNFCLRYLADLDLPKKRGTFIEFRNGLINVCPIGRNCTQEERMEFFEYDKVETSVPVFQLTKHTPFKHLASPLSLSSPLRNTKSGRSL